MSWMRQESEYNRDIPTSSTRGSETARSTAQPGSPASGSANIGQSVQIKGTLVGKEDLTIDGRVEGEIQLEEHALTIGPHGVIQAAVQAKTVVIHGRLVGNATADDKVEISATGSMQGDIRAPRVVIQDGANFRGGIDMEVGANSRSEKAEQATTVQPARQPTASESLPISSSEADD